MSAIIHIFGELMRLAPSPREDERKPNWSKDNPNGRSRFFEYEELINRDKASLDIFWLKDDSLNESENLPAPGIIAREIVEDLEAALEQFRQIAEDLVEEEKLQGKGQPKTSI
ncbi:MAG: hypothetical protein V1758_09805 [Pseudomonadota bacterium]